MTKQLLGQMIVALTPVLVPLLIALIKRALAYLPGWMIPVTAIVLGALLDVVNGWVTGANLGAPWGAVLGAAGVGVREVLDQARKSIA